MAPRRPLGPARPLGCSRASRVIVAAWSAAALVSLLGARAAMAGKNDLQLLNLCAPNMQGNECSWVKRDSDGKVTGVSFDPDATSRFRSLMSELASWSRRA